MSDTSQPPAQPESIIEYPLLFPIKVMGLNTPELVEAVTAISAKHDPEFDAASVEQRLSSEGKYLSVTVTVFAKSREHLDGLYQELSDHPLTKMVF